MMTLGSSPKVMPSCIAESLTPVFADLNRYEALPTSTGRAPSTAEHEDYPTG